jgi:arsenate reductase
MAEGLLRHDAGQRFEVFSAGTKPSSVRLEAIAVMRELGIDISGHRSKSVDEFANQQFDYVLTVCDHARESCPLFPGKTVTIHHSFEDPAAMQGSDEERLAAFRRVRDEILEYLEGFPPMNSAQTFALFASAINHHDVEALTTLMTLEHVFIDALGNRVQSATAMQAGWRGYFAMCPDYWIRTDHVMAEEGVVLAVGEAGGTIDGAPWRTPAAWKAVIRDGRAAEFRVFADNKPVYEILTRRGA